MQLEIPSADELTAQAFRFRKEDKYAAHPIEAALRYHRSQAEKSGEESHGGFDFESAEVLYRASAQGLRLSEIPQLPQSLAGLSRLGALDRAARSRGPLGLAPEHRNPRTRLRGTPFSFGLGSPRTSRRGRAPLFTMTKTWEGGSSGCTGIFTSPHWATTSVASVCTRPSFPRPPTGSKDSPSIPKTKNWHLWFPSPMSKWTSPWPRFQKAKPMPSWQALVLPPSNSAMKGFRTTATSPMCTLSPVSLFLICTTKMWCACEGLTNSW